LSVNETKLFQNSFKTVLFQFQNAVRTVFKVHFGVSHGNRTTRRQTNSRSVKSRTG